MLQQNPLHQVRSVCGQDSQHSHSARGCCVQARVEGPKKYLLPLLRLKPLKQEGKKHHTFEQPQAKCLRHGAGQHMAVAPSRGRALLGSRGQFTAWGETHHKDKAAIFFQEALAFC